MAKLNGIELLIIGQPHTAIGDAFIERSPKKDGRDIVCKFTWQEEDWLKSSLGCSLHLGLSTLFFDALRRAGKSNLMLDAYYSDVHQDFRST